MRYPELFLTALLMICIAGCFTPQPLADARRGAGKANAAANTADQQLKDAAFRLSDTIDRLGADPQTPETKALTAITSAFTEEAGTPDRPIADPTDVSGEVAEWEVAMVKARESNAVLRKEYESAVAERDALRPAIADLEKQNIALKKSLGALKPVVSILFWGILGFIGVITIGGIAYYALIRRLTSPLGTLSAVGSAVAGVIAGVVWYIHGQAFIGWGIIGAVGLACVMAVSYWRKAEMTDRLVTAVQKFRTTAGEHAAAFDAFMRENLPSGVQDKIKRLKGSLFGSG